MENPSFSIEAKRLSEVSSWLNSLFPNLNLPVEPCDEELRTCLFDGYILCAILNKLNPKFGPESQSEKELVWGKSSENVKRFLSVVEAMGLPSFKELDVNQGSMSAVVNCLLSLRACMESTDISILPNSPSKRLYLSRKRWKFLEADKMDNSDSPNGSSLQTAESSPPIGDGKRRNMSDLKFHSVFRNSATSESPSAMLHHAGYKFHEVFQLKQGRYSDLSAAKISEMVKSNGLDNAPTQSLLSVVNGILDESIDRKNDEIPQRVSCLLRKVVQEIERRISTQAEHIRNQNNLIKAREEKYQSRIRALETLATGTNEESRMVTTQLQTIKTEKIKLEEKKKQEEEDRFRLSKDKENSDLMVTKLKLEMEKKSRSHEEHCTMLEAKARETQAAMEGRIKEFELLLQQSRQRNRELEEVSESKYKSWNSKEESFKKFMDSQTCSLQGLKISSNSIRDEVMGVQKACLEDLNRMGSVIKGLAETAENYHAVLDENRKLFNEVQELKGNIRVYCRIKPFLPGQKEKLTVVDYIGENGEIMVVNPSKQGKDGSRMFKFNKVFGPTATQEDVFKDTRPLIRSVLDGYNVCIFAYGQTGSGKTYTMTGPDLMTKKEWGVNYRALDDLFQISKNRKSTINYEVAVQMVEIYNEQVRDLLTSNGAPKRLGIWTSTQPNGLAVPDASMHDVKSTTDVLDLMQLGFANRAVGATALNVRSSRSHSILSVHVRGLDMESGASLRGTLHLVDLAGSERVDRSEAVGDRLKEAQHINKSLSALGDVIFALSQKSPHVPYRNSKLTQVLQTSLGGQAKTLMFVQINPEAESFSESVSTLKFAERVSGVELGAARSSKEGKDVRELMEQVASLKDMIARKDEEIGQLRDLRAEKPTSIPSSTSLKHSSSANQLGIPTRSSHRKLLPGGNQRASSDGDIASVDSGDVDHGSCGDSEERGSDISDGYASGNTEVTTVTDVAEKTTKSIRQQSLRGGAIPRTGSVKTTSTGVRRGAVASQPSVSLGRSSKGWK